MTLRMSSAAARDTQEICHLSSASDLYASICGSEDIHIGIYKSGQDSIEDANRRTVTRMASLLGTMSGDLNVLVIGSGHCSAARFLARSCGFQVVALNPNEVENARARELNRERGLSSRINVVDGTLKKIPYPHNFFDIVWSQDAMFHRGYRPQVVAEVSRVLKYGGQFVFADPMQDDDTPVEVLEPILSQIHPERLGSPGFYRHAATKVGMLEKSYQDLTPHLVAHFTSVLRATEQQSEELTSKLSPTVLERMKEDLRQWIDSGERGHLAWGIFLFQKVVA